MSIKIVILLQQTSNVQSGSNPNFPNLPIGSPALNYAPRVHVAGWSESIWFNADNVTQLLQALTTGLNSQPGLLPARALLLAQNASVIGARLYSGGAGRGQSYAFAYPGYPGTEVDNPQQAALVNVGTVASTATRRFTLRAIPDYMITQGELDLGSTGTVTTWQGYFNALGNFAFRALDPTQPKAGILNVTAAGVVTLTGNVNPFPPNAIVVVNNTLTTGQNRASFKGVISQVGPGQQLTLQGWGLGATTGGTVSVKAYVLYAINPAAAAIKRLVTRKVGRPFELYRGRRSKRRLHP